MRYVLQSSTVGEFQSGLDVLIESCVAFKLADPHVVPPVRMNRDALRSAAEVTDAGVELDAVIARFVNEVLPTCLNFSAPTFLAHPDAGRHQLGVTPARGPCVQSRFGRTRHGWRCSL